MSDYFKHETAIIDEGVIIGDGTNIWAFSHISKGAVIGENCTIGEGVHVGPNVVIGDNCKIQNHSLLYEGVELGNNVFLGPNTVTTNDFKPLMDGKWRETPSRFLTTKFEDDACVGANSVIICGNIIGSNSLVGAGSVVTKDVPNGAVGFGNPFKIKYYR